MALAVPEIGEIIEIEIRRMNFLDNLVIENHMGVVSCPVSCDRDKISKISLSRRNLKEKTPHGYDPWNSCCYISSPSCQIVSCRVLERGKNPLSVEEAMERSKGERFLIQSKEMDEENPEYYVGYFAGKSFLGGINLAGTNIITMQKLKDKQRYRLHDAVVYLLKEDN